MRAECFHAVNACIVSFWHFAFRYLEGDYGDLQQEKEDDDMQQRSPAGRSDFNQALSVYLILDIIISAVF